MHEQNYLVKIIILFAATFAGIFIIWYSLIRDQSSDWLTGQIVHQASPYAVTTVPDGKVIISNVVMGYEFSLPKGFATLGARNLDFYLEKDGEKICEIRHYYISAEKAKKLSPDDKRAVILFNRVDLVFELVGTETEKNACAKYLKQIEASLITV